MKNLIWKHFPCNPLSFDRFSLDQASPDSALSASLVWMVLNFEILQYYQSSGIYFNFNEAKNKNWSHINKSPPLIWHHHQIRKWVVMLGGTFSYYRMVFLIGKVWVEFSLANTDSPKSDLAVCLIVLNPVLSRYVVLSKYIGYNITGSSRMYYMVVYIIYVFYNFLFIISAMGLFHIFKFFRSVQSQFL